MNQAERERILAAARDGLHTALPDAWAIYVFGMEFAQAILTQMKSEPVGPLR